MTNPTLTEWDRLIAQFRDLDADLVDPADLIELAESMRDMLRTAPAKRSQERIDFLWGVFVTALEGGIGYWARAYAYNPGEVEEPHAEGFHAMIDVEDRDNGGDFRVDIEVVARGLARIAQGGTGEHRLLVNEDMTRRVRSALAENDGGTLDAWDADAVVQAGLFGEVIYG